MQSLLSLFVVFILHPGCFLDIQAKVQAHKIPTKKIPKQAG
jgi:hypothetical protein